mgnify:CR=1 FL=1
MTAASALVRSATAAICRTVFLLESLPSIGCLLYTSDAADERSSVDLGGRRIIKKNKKLLIMIFHVGFMSVCV